MTHRYLLVRPRYDQELLPPFRGHIWHIDTYLSGQGMARNCCHHYKLTCQAMVWTRTVATFLRLHMTHINLLVRPRYGLELLPPSWGQMWHIETYLSGHGMARTVATIWRPHITHKNLLVRPWYGQELLPPSGGHIWHIETKNKGERNKVQEGIKIFYNTLKKPE